MHEYKDAVYTLVHLVEMRYDVTSILELEVGSSFGAFEYTINESEHHNLKL